MPGGGNDEITTSFSHQGATTTYDGGCGNDTIHLLFTPDQLAEILADPQIAGATSVPSSTIPAARRWILPAGRAGTPRRRTSSMQT